MKTVNPVPNLIPVIWLSCSKTALGQTLSELSIRRSSAEIKPQRRIRHVRRIILRCYALGYERGRVDRPERADVLPLVIRVILVTNIPIDVLCQLDRQPDLGHMVRERIRIDEILGPCD